MRDTLKLRENILSHVPGLAIAEKLFECLEETVFCVKNRDHRYVSVNMAFVRRVEAANKSAVLGRTARDFFPPVLAAEFERQDEIVFKTGGEIHDSLEMQTNKDGTIDWYLTQKIPLWDERQIVVALAGISTDLKMPTSDDSRLAALAGVIDQIRREYARPLRMEDLAQKAGMPLSQLERVMRAVTQLSPRQFLTKTRIDAAAGMLRNSRASLGEVAAECGFYDQAHFCKQFRAATGFSPGEYRENQREEETASGSVTLRRKKNESR